MIELAIARITSPALGSAFAIDPHTAVTAWHCLRDPDDPTKPVEFVELTFLDGSQSRAKYLQGDPVEDWAILSLDDRLAGGLQPIPLRGDVDPWEECRCLGFPASAVHAGELGFLPILARISGETVREGARRVSVHSHEAAAELDPRGLSGGPLIPRSGPEEAVGVMSRLLANEGKQIGGVLYACPAHLFIDKPLLAREDSVGELPSEISSDLADSAAAGDPAASGRIGQLLVASGDNDRAEQWLRDAALQGNATAAYELGMLMDPRGDLIERDPARARDALAWFRRAATAGDVYAITTVGIRLRQNDRNDAARPWLEEAVERGDAMAAHTLALIYEDDDNKNEAERWQRFAATRGDKRAALFLGRMLLERDRSQAADWLRRARPNEEAEKLLSALRGG